MYVKDWMTKRVFTVTPNDSVSDAAAIMKDRKIKHLPVVKGDRVVGILSDRDIKEYIPSKATSLDVYELHYLIAKTKVKEIMKKKVFSTSPDTPVEEAARLMHDENIGSLPVVEKGRLVGIISDRDIFRVLVDITGVRHGGHRVALIVEDRPGSIKEITDIIRKYGFGLQSILTTYEGVKDGFRKVVVRTRGKGSFSSMKKELEATFSNVEIRKG